VPGAGAGADRSANDLHVGAGEHDVKPGGEFAVRSQIKDRNGQGGL
jgi:hypothetical protein